MNWLDKVEQDLKHASENGDRTAQSRLYIQHIPQMIRQLRELEPVEVEVEEEDSVAEPGSPTALAEDAAIAEAAEDNSVEE
jgi:hypothetical protein